MEIRRMLTLGIGEIQTRKGLEGTIWDIRNVLYLYLSSDYMDSAQVNYHQAVHKSMHSILFIIFIILQFKKKIF